MDRFVAFLDVGYLKAASASALGRPVREIKPKPEEWVTYLEILGTPNWQYPVKAALKKMGVDEEEFGKHFKFKPRLEQKGVDTRITLDLVRLAQRRAYTAAILVAGDRDLAEPVRVAQDEGCLIYLAIPAGGGLAGELRQLADGVVELDKAKLETLFEIA